MSHPSHSYCGHCSVDCPCECHAIKRDEAPSPVYGMCTACGAVEVELNRVTGTRDLSGMGESPRYPTGYGCEVCS